MRDQGRAHGNARAYQQREHAFGQAGVGHGLLDHAPDQLGGAEVGRVRLDDDRATGRQRGRGIAARHGEREREIAGAEHRHRANRDLLQAQVGARWRAFRQGRVERGGLPAAIAQHAGEQAQLAGGAGALALQARDGQCALGVGALDQRIAQGLQAAGDRLQESGAGFRRGVAVGVECGFGQRAGTLGLGGAAAMEFRCQDFTRGRVVGMKDLGGAAHSAGADQHFAGNGHERFLLFNCDQVGARRSLRLRRR